MVVRKSDHEFRLHVWSLKNFAERIVIVGLDLGWAEMGHAWLHEPAFFLLHFLFYLKNKNEREEGNSCDFSPEKMKGAHDSNSGDDDSSSDDDDLSSGGVLV